MILEIATIEIDSANREAFESALEAAQGVVSQATGYLGHEFKKCIEHECQYILLIKWETLEAHTEGFRTSPLFKEWRGLIGEFFAKPPSVQHYNSLFQSNN